MVLPIFMRALHHASINFIVIATLLWISPSLSVLSIIFQPSFSALSNSHVFESVKIWFLQTSPLTYYWYFGRFHSFKLNWHLYTHAQIQFMLRTSFNWVSHLTAGYLGMFQIDKAGICTLLPQMQLVSCGLILILYSVNDGIMF